MREYLKARVWPELRNAMLMALLAAALISAYDLIAPSAEHQWNGRSVADWRVLLDSPDPEEGDSALAALSALEPHAPATIAAAAARLSSDDQRTSLIAIHAMIDAGRAGGAALQRVLRANELALFARRPAERLHAARVFGALGSAATPAARALVIAMDDSSAKVREAVAAALGSVLEGDRRHVPGFVFASAMVSLIRAVSDSSAGVRDAALESVARVIPNDARVPGLARAALEDPSPDVRERAAAIVHSLRVRHGR